MPINLKYKHQQKTYELMTKELNEYGQAAYSFPTGAGKTFPSLKYLEDNPEQNALIVVPTRVIKRQWEKYIKEGISNGDKRIKAKRIEVITYSKLSLLMKKVKNLNVDVFILDEAQAMGAETYEPAIDQFREQHPNVKEIAMTATPERMDGRNMLYEKYGEHVVYEMSLTDALSGEKEGEVILNAPRYVRVLSQLRSVIDEYKTRIENESDKEKRDRLIEKYKRLSTIVANSPDIEEIMQLGMKKKNGKYIVFCKDREDLQDKMQKAERIFGKVNKNIKKYYILSKGEGEIGKTNAQNDAELENFENAKYGEELQLLFCVDMLNLGKHINSENIDGEVMFRETSSKIVYKQQIGRVMTAGDESDEKVIIDAANNWLRQIDTFTEFEGAISQGQANGYRNKFDEFRLQGEELEFLTLLREIGEECHFNYYNTYEQLIEWLETHNGEMPRKPRKNVSEMTKEEKYASNLYDRWQYTIEKKILDEYVGITIEEVPENYRKRIEKLRNFGLGIKKETTYEQLINWLETHEGEMPRQSTKKVNEMTDEEYYEYHLYHKWQNANEKKILDKYASKSVEEIPEQYREKIAKLRSFELGLKTKQPVFEQIIEWLETHNGEMPHSCSKSKKERTNEENDEHNLYHRWLKLPERKILEEYLGKSIEEIPEQYREKIAKLRSFGLGVKEKTTYEQIIEWLEKNDGKMPQQNFLYQRWLKSSERKILEKYAGKSIEKIPEQYRDKISKLRSFGLGVKEKSTYEQLVTWLETHNGELPKDYKTSKKEITEEEKYERGLCDRWRRLPEKKILEEYAGKSIEEVPEEYRDKVSRLRSFGLGIKEKSTYEQIIEWLEMHDGEMPQQRKDDYSRNLYNRWIKSKEKEILEEYVGKSIEEVPEEYKEKIATLRNFGLGFKEKTTYELLIDWLKVHNGKMPRDTIKCNKIRKKNEELTDEERDEVRLSKRWRNAPEKDIFDKYAGKSIEDVPEEYRDIIVQFRNFGLGLKASKIQKAKQKRDDAKAKNNEAKELEQQVSSQLKKRGKSYDEQ